MEDQPGRRDRERDLILGPGEYANILDETKGHVTVWVGPSKASLSQTDRPVRFDPKERKFVPCSLEESILVFPFAERGSYIVLHNPVVNNPNEPSHPNSGSNVHTKLDYGNKINIEGPQTFALFPGQYAETLHGHRMRSNQYLIVRVYDEDAAKENWSKATIKLQKKDEGGETPQLTEKEKVEALGAMPDLTMGRLLIIEGTKVSFYIPPTGIEVIADENGKYVRDAITLERLEYCILLDEDGNKRYVTGPAVVFPRPTETFVEKNKERKFRAIELNDLMGIYVKVIADYDENGTSYKAGDELFITGKDQKIYYPRPEHAIIKYGDQMVSYAIAIPEGEARYVLNRDTGEITLKRGPAMFLPNPIHEVVVRRILTPRQVELWLPGNNDAKEYNRTLTEISTKEGNAMAYVSEKSLAREMSIPTSMRTAHLTAEATETVGLAVTEELKRGSRFTPPRTVTLDTKYDGAVSIDVWPGYAVQVVSKTGDRKVIVGPKVYLLEYDETLEKMSFSTGTPKTDERLKNDVYLRVLQNTISDLIKVETKDLCPVSVLVSYRVNFEGEATLWFNVENYVKFLTDHIRSVLRNKVKQLGIEEFYGNSIDIIRDTVLGAHPETTDDTPTERPGRFFKENGMRVYDLEVLGLQIENDEISELLEDSQHEAVSQRLMVEKAQNELETTQKTEKIQQSIEEAKAETARKKYQLLIDSYDLQLKASLGEINIRSEVEKQKATDMSSIQDIQNEVENKRLELIKAKETQALEIANEKMEQMIKQLQAETTATTAKAAAVTPDLIAVLQNFANKDLAGKLAENFNVLAFLGGKSIVEVAQSILSGTEAGEVLKNLQLHVHNK
jgi:major vault protein